MEKINTDFENWGSYLMKQFHTMFEKSERCDLEISCNKQIFLVHRLVMSACSDYVRELGETEHIILPEEISCKTLKTIIDFVYSGKIIFHKEDKEDLLIAASLLNMRLLLELIRREDSSSYTISMDDDNDENCETELINSGTAENCRISTDDNPSREQNSHTASKRKSDKKSVKNKSPKKNCVVLPPLHKNLTSPTPSRFEISEAELENSSVRSTFHDVTYDTQRLSDPDKLKSLEAAHIQFLKKQKTTSVNRRNYTNALYSPFDKYTPPCNLKLSDSVITRRPESIISYPSKVDAASGVRKYHANNNVHSREMNGRPPSSRIAALSSSALPTTKEYKKQDTTKTASNSANYPPEKRVRFSDDVTIREIDIPFTEAIINDLESLPEPIMPSAVMQDATSLSDSGHEVELIKLNNVVVPTDLRDDRTTNRTESEENIVSISLVPTDTCESRNTISESRSDFTTNETMEVEENQSLCQVSSQLETNDSTTSIPNNEINVNQVPNPGSVDAVDNVSEESLGRENIDSGKNSHHSNINDSNSIERVSQPATLLSSVDRVSTDATLFTPLNTNTNSAQTSTELNSQIFAALKVKGTESPAQLDKLVDLCKNNPLFKNKNICFKIISVKGSMQEKLNESTLKTNRGINKAIIVKRTENSAMPIATSSVETSSTKVTDLPKRTHASDDGAINSRKDRVALIENISGPWDCTKCGTEPLTFNSYYDYRTHMHSIHKEPNNPVYCMYCGHKSLKRNMQLYHLFIKHNVKPPSHIKFPKCDKCEFYALNEYYLQKHLICHPSEGMEYVCSCKVAFKSCELLQKHMVSGDCKNTKSFKCGYCQGIFDRFVNLKAHMRVCMKERSKPMLENSIGHANPERSTKTATNCGRDYVAL